MQICQTPIPSNLAYERPDKLTDCMLFNTVININSVTTRRPVHPGFLEFRIQVLRSIFFPNNWLLYKITTIETKVRSEREMIPIAMTMVSLQKYIGQARHRTNDPHVLKLPTELPGLGPLGRMLSGKKTNKTVE